MSPEIVTFRAVASLLLLTEATRTGVPERKEHPHASMDPEME